MNVNTVKQFLPQEYWHLEMEFFSYQAEWNTLAASAVAQQASVVISTKHHFVALAAGRSIADAAGTTELTTHSALLIKVIDSSQSTAWMNAAVPLDVFAGKASGDSHGPFKWPAPRLVLAGSELTFELTNLAATARRVWLTLFGVKLILTR